MQLTIKVNDKTYSLEIESRALLSDVLRDTLGLTGTHRGCDTAQCGACTVHVEGRAVKSCNVLALQVDGCNVTTIEGVTGGADELNIMQQSFQQCHGLQCGFCTPGMVMAGMAYLTDHPNPSRVDIRKALEGNICRCTGYENIVRAVEQAAAHYSQS